MSGQCTVKGCDRSLCAKGYCNMHYNRIIRRGGNAELPTDGERFWAKVDKSATCWNWTGAKDSKGYGLIMISARTEKAHRVSYQWTNGPIPEDRVIDHRCHNKACVNPCHLRAVTQKQNTENQTRMPRPTSSGVRGVVKYLNGRWQARVTHHGKAYSGGVYDTVEEAEAAAIALRLRLFTHNDLDRQQQKAS